MQILILKNALLQKSPPFRGKFSESHGHGKLSTFKRTPQFPPAGRIIKNETVEIVFPLESIVRFLKMKNNIHT